MPESSLRIPQTILIIGGTSDIGFAIARQLVDSGAQHVILAGRNEAALRDRAAQLPCRTTIETFDARETDGHRAFVERVSALGSDIDLAIVAAGTLISQTEAVADPSAAVAMAEVNYVGAMSVMLHLARQVRAQAHGTLLVLSSIAAVRSRPSNYVYGSTKAALDSFAQGLSLDLDGTGASVVIVRPGFVETKMTAGLTGPFAVTADAAGRTIARRLTAGARVIWVPRFLAVVAVALRLLPRPLLRRLPL